MCSTKQFLAIFVCVLSLLPSVAAQDTRSVARISNEVTIIIQRQQVRFTAQKTVEEMRLQVFNQTGETAFDSGSVTGAEINWPLHNGDGQSLKSGLYAYKLSVRESGTDTARDLRGHFIVDRAADRDAGSDQLWVTSPDAGVGAELTVARGENLTVAGITSASDRSVPRQDAGLNRGGGREIETGAQSSVETNKTSVAAVAAGTVGKIAKFTSATDVGDSVITELNGNIGVGAANPTHRLSIAGGPLWTSNSWSGAMEFQNGAALAWQANAAGQRAGLGHSGGGTFFFRTTSDPGATGSQADYDLMISDTGNFGVGTTSLTASRMTIEGQNALTIRGFEPFLTLQDRNQIPLLGTSHRIQSAHSDLVFSQEVFFVSGPVQRFDFIPRMVIKDDGNTGIGNIAPRHQLSLGRGPQWTANSWGGSVELVNGAAIGWQANTAGNRFGIGHTNGGLFFFRTSSDPGTVNAPALADLTISDTGVTAVRVLQIMGGADFSENFDVNEKANDEAGKIEPGMVVSIDPANPGRLKLSSRAYDRRVAGVISGAGGVKPGMVMGQEGTLADGKHPIALSGRVYCWVDASRAAIKPGDLLTTSPMPGYAMKVTNPAKAQGAIIGKAMTGLKRGKGLALVLVTLQ